MTKEQLEFIIGRYDHYYDSVNNKGQFYLGLNTFIIGSMGAAFSMLNTSHTCTICLYVLLAIILLIGFTSTYYTLRAILPYLKPGDESASPSLIFFGSVSKLTKEQYLTKVSSVSAGDVVTDLISQAHQLALGLSLKFGRLKIAGLLIACEFAFLIPFLILFFINIK